MKSPRIHPKHMTGFTLVVLTSLLVLLVFWNQQLVSAVDMPLPSGAEPTTIGLVAYYKFDEGSGTTTADSSGNSLNGQYVGNWINTNLPDIGFENLNALSFNGTSNFVYCPPATINDLSAGTITAWVYLNTRDQEVITAKQYNNINSTAIFSVGLSGAANLASDIQTPGVLYFHAKNATGFNAAGVTALNIGQWYHVGVTFTAAQAKIYVNGILDSTTNGDFSVPNLNAPTIIGAWLGDGLIDGRETNYLNGRLDEVRIYDRPLSDIEMRDFVTSSEFSVSAIVANKGGNSGDVSVSVLGGGYQSGTTVKLKTFGQPDIEGANPIVVNRSRITTTFNLRGTTPGLRDVVVTLPDGSTATLRDGFTIEEGGSPHLWVDILGRNQVRAGQQATFQILVGNSGNVDMGGFAVLQLSVPDGVSQVTAKYNGLDVGTFDPGVALQVNTSSGLNEFALQTSPMVLAPWTVGEISAHGQVIITASMTPSQSGTLSAQVLTVPPDRTGEVVFTLLNAKANELGVGFPNSDALFVDAVKTALTQTLAAGVKKLADPGEARIAFSEPEFVRNNAMKANQMVSDQFPGPSQAFIAALIAMNTPRFSFLLFSNYKRLVPRPQAVMPVDKLIQIVTSRDPNDKVGSLGVGSPRYLSGQEPLRYAIYFENVATATAPAQEVVITDQLDTAKLDLNTFSLGPITFGNKLVIPPPGLSEFNQDVDLRPANNLIVRINARLDKSTGLLTWRFTSIDPATGLPPEDPLAGFLPPNVTPPEGDGSVLFTVMPKQGLATGTEIRNQARIIFDTNAPIDTPQWFNTLDNTKPTSNVLSLPAVQNSASFQVQWQGTDVGAGVLDYTISVSENGGLFTPWLRNTIATSGTFTGQPGKTYAFYSVARDRTGNTEAAPTLGDATTQISMQAPAANLAITKTASPNPVTTGSNITYTIRVTNNGPSAATSVMVTDNLPTSTTYVSCAATGGGVCGGAGNSRTVTFTSLASGASATITLGATANCSVANGTVISNTATVSSSTPDPDPTNNTSNLTQTMTVTNSAPVVTLSVPASGTIYSVGTPVIFTGSFTDNPGGTHTATWSFDTINQAGMVNELTGAVTATHTFTAAGVYLVTLTVSDGCGGTGTAITVDGLTAMVVVYDPNGGFVTGGGWINSPAGAYVPNPSLTGKANFGFVSKYQNGASVPTGNTEFQFKAGNLNFSSTSYEWLVVAGKKAQYKGFGTINGSGSYRFMLTAIDGQQPGGGGQDKFRIRIWSDGGGLVYDNQMNDPDSSDPTTVLGGGSIVIHK